MGLEGIVSKRKGSWYSSGRSRDWLKAKNPKAPASDARKELLKMASDPDPIDKHVGNRIRLRLLRHKAVDMLTILIEAAGREPL
jgi:hypothetical protein